MTPDLSADPVSLIRRSPAPAPLLDALKDRKTRDAVQSVLERLTGARKPAAAAAPAARGGQAELTNEACGRRVCKLFPQAGRGLQATRSLRYDPIFEIAEPAN